jgi:hypothetical protein
MRALSIKSLHSLFVIDDHFAELRVNSQNASICQVYWEVVIQSVALYKLVLSTVLSVNYWMNRKFWQWVALADEVICNTLERAFLLQTILAIASVLYPGRPSRRQQ